MKNIKKAPCLLWPVAAIWRLFALVAKTVGRLVTIIFGLVLIAIGVIFSFTIIGLIIGVPLMTFGFLLLVRGIF